MPFCIEEMERAGHLPYLLHFYLTEAEAVGAFQELKRRKISPLLWASRLEDGVWVYFDETPAGVAFWGESLAGKPWKPF